MIDDHVTGLLVPFGDAAALAGAVEDLIDDPARRSRWGGRANIAPANGFRRKSSCHAMKRYTGEYVIQRGPPIDRREISC